MNRTAAAQLKSTGAGPPAESKFKRGKAISFMGVKSNVEERHQIIATNYGTQNVVAKSH
jgi:hypothetical protein